MSPPAARRRCACSCSPTGFLFFPHPLPKSLVSLPDEEYSLFVALPDFDNVRFCLLIFCRCWSGANKRKYSALLFICFASPFQSLLDRDLSAPLVRLRLAAWSGLLWVWLIRRRRPAGTCRRRSAPVMRLRSAFSCGKNSFRPETFILSLFLFHVGKRLAGCRPAAAQPGRRGYHTLAP